MNSPKRRFANFKIFQNNIFTAVELDELRPEISAALCEHALFDALAVHHLPKHFTANALMYLAADKPIAPLSHFRRERPLSDNSDIGASVRVNERRIIHAFDALPACLYDGETKFRIVLENNKRAFVES